MGNHSFARNVFTLLGGTSIALAIPLLFSPLLTRLYSPEAFGQFALYSSIVSIGAIAATGRFELAIALPRRNEIAFCLASLSLLLSAVFCAMYFVVILIVLVLDSDQINKIPLPLTLILITPAGILLLSFQQTLTYWMARKQQYKSIALSRGTQSITATFVQALLGTPFPNPVSLTTGHLIGITTGLIKFLPDVKRDVGQFWHKGVLRKIQAAGLRHLDLPKFMIAGHLANMVSSQLPVLMLAALYGPKQAGLYALAERVSLIPYGVVFNSIGEVYRQEAAKQFHTHRNCLHLYLKTTKKLALLGIIPSIGFFLLAPYTFEYIFGSSWGMTGEIASLLGALIFFQGISSPLSQTVLFASMFKADLGWQFFRLVATAMALYAGYHFLDDLLASVLFFVVVQSVTYSIHSAMQLAAARGDLKSKNMTAP